jgi:hypothetical protein
VHFFRKKGADAIFSRSYPWNLFTLGRSFLY